MEPLIRSAGGAAPCQLPVGGPFGAQHEAALIERVARRDRAAFRELYEHYHRRITAFLRRFVRREDWAEEIVNDTLYVVWCKAPEFRGASRLSTWIMGIAYRRALKALNSTAHRTVAASVELDSVEAGSPDFVLPSPEESREQRDWLDTALAELPLEQRMVLELTYYLGHSCEEIAAIMDCPVNTVKTRMFNARAKLRSRLPVLAGTAGAGGQGERP